MEHKVHEMNVSAEYEINSNKITVSVMEPNYVKLQLTLRRSRREKRTLHFRFSDSPSIFTS